MNANATVVIMLALLVSEGIITKEQAESMYWRTIILQGRELPWSLDRAYEMFGL